MKIRLLTAIALSAGFLMTGCTTPTYRMTNRGTESMQETRIELDRAFGQVTRTITSLDNLMNTPVGDLRPRYRDFGRELRTLERAAESARSRAVIMQTRNESFFTSWAHRIDTIQDPAIRASSLERYNSTRAEYSALEESLFAVSDAYAPVLSGLTDIHTALGHDLTLSGIRALQPSYTVTRNQAIALQAAIREATVRIDALTTDLSTVAEMGR